MILLKASLAVLVTLLIRDFCRHRDIQGVAFPAATVPFLCFGIWEMA